MASPAAQPYSGNPYVPTHRYQSAIPATGPAFVVSRDEVLAKHRELLTEADDFQRFLDAIKEQLFMQPCGNDPVSIDVAAAVTDRLVGPGESYWNVCQQWVTNLYQTANALAETARQYGFTDEDIAASFSGGVSSA